ncbi:MAG: ROK family protein [Bacteroidetes bacterium]|nr:ROK family protein [Bacteroidota bacterium]
MEKMKIIAGVDIGGTNSVIGLVEKDGKYLLEETIKTNSREEIEKYIPRLADKIIEMCKEVSSDYELASIGIAAPCGNYFTGIIENPSNFNWGNVNIVEQLKRYFTIPIVVTNDANAAALGEQVYGSAIGIKNFILLTLGTGLGCGIISEGRLLYGANGLAGELGHTVVQPRGRKCNCGNSGCLETYISANGLRRTVSYFLSKSNAESELRNISFNEMTGDFISELALKGDLIAKKTFEFTGEILGRAMANIVNSFDPQKIILFGGLAEAGELLLTPTKKYFEENLLSMYKGKVDLGIAELQNGRAAVLGVSYLAMEEIKRALAS